MPDGQRLPDQVAHDGPQPDAGNDHDQPAPLLPGAGSSQPRGAGRVLLAGLRGRQEVFGWQGLSKGKRGGREDTGKGRKGGRSRERDGKIGGERGSFFSLFLKFCFCVFHLSLEGR